MTNIVVALLLLPQILFANNEEIITISSDIFEEERQITVITPNDFKYQSDLVKLPVIYVLDGQHEWFVNPVLSNIEYLQYTHELPNALVVVIPHTNRNIECALPNKIDGPESKLHRFITEEIEQALINYNPNDFRLIIGHSLSASFALYSFHRGNGFYSAVIGHSPYDQLANLVDAMSRNTELDLTSVYLSIGSIDHDKDKYHRDLFDEQRRSKQHFFSKVTVFDANEATHNAVPIVANPILLSKLFYSFSRRFGQIARVDPEYRLVDKPDSPAMEMNKLRDNATLGGRFYAPEIPELFGLASRYQNSGYNEQTIAVYEEAIKFYPTFFDFYLSLYSLYIETDPAKARKALEKAYGLVKDLEQGMADAPAILEEIEVEMKTHGWE